MAMTAAQMKDKIEKLLAKAERTDNDHERDAFTAKAQRLMLEWGIAEADLEAQGEVKREDIVEEHRTYRGGMADAMCTFVHKTVQGMGNLRMFRTPVGSQRQVWVIGHKTDVANFWTLMNSLEIQVAAARANYILNDELYAHLSKWEQHKAQRTFTVAFGTEVGHRLFQLRKVVQQDATPGAALVLVDKKEQVDSYVEKNHSLTPSRGMSHGAAGGGAGRAAGAKADLGGKSVRGGSAGQLR